MAARRGVLLSTPRSFPFFRGNSQCTCRADSGTSLQEVLVCLAIFTTLAAFSTNLYPLVLQQRMVTQVNQLLGSLHLARSEAIKRGHTVTLCKSANGLYCTHSSPWEFGWIIFADPNGNRRVDSGDTIIRVAQMEPGVRLSLRASFGHNNDVTYRPGGFTEKNGTFTFCDQRGTSAARAIILFRTGRPRFSLYSAEGKKLSCRN